MEKGKIKLKVIDIYERDMGRHRVRLPRKKMGALGVKAGELLALEKRRKTVAYVWPDRPGASYKKDQNYVRLDKLTRKNVGANRGEEVVVYKTNASPARKVVFSPTSSSFILPEEEDKTTQYLENIPVFKEDLVRIPHLDKEKEYKVLRTVPEGPVIISRSTNMHFKKREKRSHQSGPRFEDIGGLKEEIKKVRELVELPIQHPELFNKMNMDPPKGILFHGPPGTGKTLMARAIANTSKSYFISISGPEIMSKFYGESEANLRKKFEEAQKHSPAIIFIDEIDAIAPKREEVRGDVEKRVVAQLLSLMDGLKRREEVVVIGATNRADALDPALRRAGRFDREIEFGVPDLTERYEILRIHTRGLPLAKGVNLRKIAEMTHGFVGADIASLVKEAGMRALRDFTRDHKAVVRSPNRIPDEKLEKLNLKMNHFQKAIDSTHPSALREIFLEVPDVRWEDIGGLDSVKNKLKEVVEWPIKYSRKLDRMGIEPPKGILLYGPPGCGKTMLAKAIAYESQANFISVKGPELLSKWVGESEKALREVFRKGRQASPTVIFFDEIDALAPQRGQYTGGAGVSERVISQLLTEMDGLTPKGKVIVTAATNRPDMLDPALLRPGRIDRIIYVPSPSLEERQEILNVHSRDVPMTSSISLKKVAKETTNFTGADLKALIKESAMNSLRRDLSAKIVTKEDVEKALDMVSPSLTDDLKEYYEEMQKMFEEKGMRGKSIYEEEGKYIT